MAEIDEKALQMASRLVTNTNMITPEIAMRKAREIIEAYESARSATPAVGDYSNEQMSALIDAVEKFHACIIGGLGATDGYREAMKIMLPYLHTLAPSQPLREALIRAREAIEMLHEHGNFDNGVYDPTGSICEGVVMTTRYVSECLADIDKALSALPQQNVTEREENTLNGGKNTEMLPNGNNPANLAALLDDEGMVEVVANAIEHLMRNGVGSDGKTSVDHSGYFLPSWFFKAAQTALKAVKGRCGV